MTTCSFLLGLPPVHQPRSGEECPSKKCASFFLRKPSPFPRSSPLSHCLSFFIFDQPTYPILLHPNTHLPYVRPPFQSHSMRMSFNAKTQKKQISEAPGPPQRATTSCTTTSPDLQCCIPDGNASNTHEEKKVMIGRYSGLCFNQYPFRLFSDCLANTPPAAAASMQESVVC